MLNQPLQSRVTQPRGLVKVNGEVAKSLLEFSVDTNSFYQANTFNVTLSLQGQPENRGVSFWADVESAKVEVFAGYPDDPENFSDEDLTLLLVGETDDVTANLIGRTVELIGRDYTAKMIEELTTEKFQNLTSSEIVEQIAKKHGLKPEVTSTQTKTGVFYKEDHIRLTDQRTEWDLLSYLASRERFFLYVEGEKLIFRPFEDESREAYVLTWDEALGEGDITDLRVQRSLTLSREIVVQVRSWNAQKKEGFTVRRSAAKAKRQQNRGGTAQVYSYVFPGLTEEEALQRAEKILREISAHELRLEAELPADQLIHPETPILLQGTGSSFDQRFYVDHVVRSYSLDRGYTMTVRAKNHATDTQVLA